MPTDIHFVGSKKPAELKEDDGPVTSLLHGSAVAQFHLVPNGVPVTVYRSGIAFVTKAPAASFRRRAAASFRLLEKHERWRFEFEPAVPAHRRGLESFRFQFGQ